MLTFKEFILLQKIEYIALLVPESAIENLLLLNESRWIEAGVKGWVFRVDAADPKIPQQRHVHISREKHKSAKTQQASWNEDGSRHDKKTFNAEVGRMKVVRDLARSALKLPPEIMLEDVGAPEDMMFESLSTALRARIEYVQFSD